MTSEPAAAGAAPMAHAGDAVRRAAAAPELARTLVADSAAIDALAQDGFDGARVGLILGSGWGHFIDVSEVLVASSYTAIPGFGESTVPGHAGRLVRGRLRSTGGKSVEFLAMQGRLHRYEGHPMTRIAGAVATLAALGVTHLVVTNAAGGVNPGYQVGDLVRIHDFIHFMRESPVAGVLPALRSRSALSERLGREADAAAARAGISLGRGVLFASKGPTYETPAEVRMVRTFGGDLVSMSTAPELIAAGALGMEAVAFSCVTNMAPGVVPGRVVNHEEVIEVMTLAKSRCAALLSAVVECLSADADEGASRPGRV